MSELKPCPFCGAEVKKIEHIGVVYCHECNLSMLPETWNTRPIEDELRKSNARLGAGLDECLAFLNHLAEEYPSIRAHATRFERVRRLIEFPYQPKGECRWRDTALQISKLHGEAEADAERLANEYTKTLKEIGGVYWEEPEEISPALILHKMRKGR